MTPRVGFVWRASFFIFVMLIAAHAEDAPELTVYDGAGDKDEEIGESLDGGVLLQSHIESKSFEVAQIEAEYQDPGPTGHDPTHCPCPSGYPICMYNKGHDGTCCPSDFQAGICGKWCCQNEGTCCAPDMCPCLPGEKCMAPVKRCCPKTESLDPVWCGTEEDGECCDSQSNCFGNKCYRNEVLMRRTSARPAFLPNVQEGFRARCKAIQQYPWYPMCSGNSVHLAHVRSWEKIRDYTIDVIRDTNWGALRGMVDVLFQIDEEAVIWYDLEPWKKVMLHKKYMGADLILLNEQLRAQSHCLVNQLEMGVTEEKKTDLLKLMNSAPANLRYGIGTINSSIQGHLDPMGNIRQHYTSKEITWVHGYSSSTRQVQAGESCVKCNGGCGRAVSSSSASEDGSNYYVCTN